MTPMMSAIFLLAALMPPMALDRRAHHRAALLRLLARRHRELIRLAGVVGGLLDRRGHLFHRGSGLFEARSLLLGALRKIQVALEISSAPACTSRGSRLHALDQFGRGVEHRVDATAQRLEFAGLACHRNARRQVAFGRRLHGDLRLLHGELELLRHLHLLRSRRSRTSPL